MRKMLAMLALAAAVAVSAQPMVFAQYNDGGQQQGWHGRGHRMDPDAELQRMTQRLNLTSEQQEQIRPILVDRQQKMQALFQNQSLSREDRRSQMMSIRQDSNAKIEKLLTDQQKQEFEEMQQRHGHHGWRNNQTPPADDSGPQ